MGLDVDAQHYTMISSQSNKKMIWQLEETNRLEFAKDKDVVEVVDNFVI